MSNICKEELISDAQKSSDMIYKQKMKLEFYRVIDNLFLKAVNDYIDKGNEYSEDKREFADYILNYIKRGR